MSRSTLLLLLLTAGSVSASSSTTVTRGTLTMPAATMYNPSRLPSFGGYTGSEPSPTMIAVGAAGLMDDSVPADVFLNQIMRDAPKLPYRDRNDYTLPDASAPRALDTIVMENARFKATIFPWFGGKVASLVDKRASRPELLYANPVFQPQALARLNAWTSGGIEWNWPRLGHSVFTAAPMYAALVDTGNSSGGSEPVLRLYEFDREMNTTFQIDLMLGSDEGSNGAALYAHAKVVNPHLDHNISAYWWTNVAAKINTTSRVLFGGAQDGGSQFAVTNGHHGLYRVPFPMFSDNQGAAGFPINDTGWHATDHSFPHNYYNARETFIRCEPFATCDGAARGRSWMGAVDTATGQGFAHAQSPELNGRKYWNWGNASDTNRQNALSLCPGSNETFAPVEPYCDNAAYIEMQAGVAPTQSNMFQLAAGATLEWTEAWSALSVDPSAVAPSVAYADAVAAGERALDATIGMTVADFTRVDARMRGLSSAPLVAAGAGGTLAHGTAWGRVHAALLAWAAGGGGGGTPAPYGGASLRFDAPVTPAERPFLELLGAAGTGADGDGAPLRGGAVGTFSAASLSRLAPLGFMADPAWVAVLQQSAVSHGWTWLHHLHLGIAVKQLDGPGAAAAAAAHFNASWNANLNALALLLSGKTDAAWSAALAGVDQACGTPSSSDSGTESTCTDAVDLARDVGTEALNAARGAADWASVAKVLADVDEGPMPAAAKERLLGCQAFRVAAIALAVHGNPLRGLAPDPAVAVALLQRGPWSGCERGSTGALMGLWSAAQYALEAKARGVASLDALGQLEVRQQHPPPRSIDFAGAD